MLKSIARSHWSCSVSNVQHGIGGGKTISGLIVGNTEDVFRYLRELDKGKAMMKRLGLSVQTRACVHVCCRRRVRWSSVRSTRALAAFAAATAKTADAPEFSQWLKNLDNYADCVGQPVPRT